MLTLRLRAIRDGVCGKGAIHNGPMSEEELALGDAPPGLPRIDGVGDVVPGLAIEVAAMAVHGLNAGVHGDPDIEVVGPAHHLQVQMPRMVNVQNVLSQRPLGIIHEFALAVVLQSQRPARVLIGEGCQNLLAIARDLPIVHRPHRKHVPLHGRATQGHLVCRGGVVREGRVEVPDLDADLGALHQPELTLFVEVWERVIEGLDVWVAPQEAIARRACGRRLQLRQLRRGGRARRHQHHREDGKHADGTNADEDRHSAWDCHGWPQAELAHTAANVPVRDFGDVRATLPDPSHRSSLAGAATDSTACELSSGRLQFCAFARTLDFNAIAAHAARPASARWELALQF
mmetsp:Transcript_67594/g.194221  ORF Transcript_67594/g.194221 Transcript_67594/m.194221 type:complete len:346 (-) Transcript_67594:12-1049(-)